MGPFNYKPIDSSCVCGPVESVAMWRQFNALYYQTNNLQCTRCARIHLGVGAPNIIGSRVWLRLCYARLLERHQIRGRRDRRELVDDQ